MTARCSLTILLLLAAAPAAAGQDVRGTVRSQEPDGSIRPVAGANVYWLGTTVGTATGPDGAFALSRAGSDRLVVRHAAFRADTIAVGERSVVAILLLPSAHSLEEVQVVGEQSATAVDYLSPESRFRITERELEKAACCNLSESFETNPSVDVTYTDAITGTRQIEMLGLSGVYTQITTENVPAIRGLSSGVGLTFVPGTWINAISVSRGIGSVANGYESMTGQIDVELRRPQAEDEPRLYLNAYGNQDLRLEGNLNFRQPLGERWSSMTLMHASAQRTEVDGNGDAFLDMPRFATVNLLQRWHYAGDDGWEGDLAVQYVGERREGGTRESFPGTGFPYASRPEQLRVAGKAGHVFRDDPGRSLGLQYSLARYRTTALYGARSYDGLERTAYLNLIYQTELGSPLHRLRAGASLLVDDVDEQFAGRVFERTEQVPGVFGEYTFEPSDGLTLVAGLRADRHNHYGTVLTPRAHLRIAPDRDWVVRAVAGRGYRTASIFAEHPSALASNRAVVIEADGTFGYGLAQEAAWNLGLSLTRYVFIQEREGTVSVDFYRTMFDRQVVADLDATPREARFATTGASHANSLQLELNLPLVDGLDVRTAYRYLDVRETVGGVRREKALTARHRAFVHLAHGFGLTADGRVSTTVNLTVQWFGPKRIPSTEENPPEFRARERSPSFATVHAQVARELARGVEFYLGGENLLDFRQDNPIIGAADPSSPWFDAGLVWGPVAGRMLYAGVRYRL